LNFQKQELNLVCKYDYYYLLNYTPEIKYLLQKFKFHKDLLAADIFSHIVEGWWSKLVSDYFADVDALAAVPIHRYRYMYRGFNQAEFIVQKLSEHTALATTFENYSRIKYTKSQAKSSKDKRIQQINGVFRLDKPIRAKHLLVFDDVLTTGSTMNEFVETISKGSQIDKISIVTLVRPI